MFRPFHKLVADLKKNKLEYKTSNNHMKLNYKILTDPLNHHGNYVVYLHLAE